MNPYSCLNKDSKEDYSKISIEISIKIMDGTNVIHKDLAHMMQFSKEDHSRILSLINENKIFVNVVNMLNELIRKEQPKQEIHWADYPQRMLKIINKFAKFNGETND